MNDLVARIVAAIAFIVMWLMQLPVGVAAVLGVATYLGVRFLMPSPAKVEMAVDPIVAAQSSVDKLRGYALTPPSVQRKLNDVCAKASSLLSYLAQNTNGNVDAPIMVQQYLSLLNDAVGRYAAATAGSGSEIGEASKSIADLLDGLAERFGSLRDKLVKEGDAEISGEIKALNQTLTDMDSLTLKVRGDSS